MGSEEDTSFFKKVKNLISYKINNTVDNVLNNPDAEKYAKEQEEKKKKKEETPAPVVEGADTTGPSSTDPPSTTQQIKDKLPGILSRCFGIFVVLVLSMFVANEMIMYAYPIRLIFFLFTFFMCYTFTTMRVGLTLFYFLKWAYSYYVNNMTERPKIKLLPKIFALLPLTTKTSKISLVQFLLYPFRYPKTEKDRASLPMKEEAYEKELEESCNFYKDIEQDIKKDKEYTSNLEKLNNFLSHMHDDPVPESEEAPVPKEAPVPNTIELPPGEEKSKPFKNNKGQEHLPPTIGNLAKKNNIEPGVINTPVLNKLPPTIGNSMNQPPSAPVLPKQTE